MLIFASDKENNKIEIHSDKETTESSMYFMQLIRKLYHAI